MRSAERGMRNGSQSLVTSSPTLVACPHPQPLSHPMGRGGGEKLPQRLKQPPCCGRGRPHSDELAAVYGLASTTGDGETRFKSSFHLAIASLKAWMAMRALVVLVSQLALAIFSVWKPLYSWFS